MRRMSLGRALREALNHELPSGWLYLPDAAVLTPETPCIFFDDSEIEDDEHEAFSGDFPREGLSTDLMEDTGEAARLLLDPPSEALLVESFEYYLRFDAFLPEAGAPAPPSREETQARLDREFVTLLGRERSEVRCRHDRCGRGAVLHSMLCKKHHFESIQGRRYPFDD